MHVLLFVLLFPKKVLQTVRAFALPAFPALAAQLLFHSFSLPSTRFFCTLFGFTVIFQLLSSTISRRNVE